MGRFIVIYGSNNLGKSKQLDLLEKEYIESGLPYTRIKYPIYDSPTGEIINSALRPDKEGRCLEICDEDLQCLYAENRRQFEPALISLLEKGDVIAEDYTGTGLAWGITKGVDKDLLFALNEDLRRPDVEILLDGERFGGAVEKGHRHESAGQEVWETSRRVHLELASELGWEIVNANQSIEEVHGCIMRVLA